MNVAKILVVDDRAVNRQLLVSLLGYANHAVIEAADGAEALQVARAEHLDLIITDIVMPTMDGFEFVQKLRADTSAPYTPVIFYSATYIEREARSLARACGVSFVITKPAEPQKILDTVAMALGTKPSPATQNKPKEEKSAPMDILAEKFIEKSRVLEAVTLRLAALIEVGLELASHRDPGFLLQTCCHAARKIIGAKYSAVGILEEGGKGLRHVFRSGMTQEVASAAGAPDWTRGVIADILREKRACRRREITVEPAELGFDSGHPKIKNLIGVPLLSPHFGAFGWLSLADKLGAEEFSEEDERVALTLSAQIAVSYENARLSDELSAHSAKLQEEVEQRTRAREAAQAARDYWELTFQTVPDPILIIGEDCRITQANHAVSLLTGLLPSQIVGKHCYEVLHGTAEARPDCPHQEVLRSAAVAHGEIYESWLNKWFSTTAAPLQAHDGAPPACVHVFRDITERKLNEEALRKSKEHLALAQNVVEMASWEMDLKTGSMTWSEGIFKLMGLKPPDEPFPIANPYKYVHPEDRERLQRELSEAVTSRKPLSTEFRIVRLNDNEVRNISIVSKSIYDKSGDAVRLIGTTHDITERKKLEEQLVQAQKMEAVGRLAGGVAHDFNNLLTIILGRGQLAIEKLGPDDPNRESLDEIMKAGDRAAGLTRQLLAFSRRQVLQPRVLDLNAVVTDLSKLLRRLIGEDIQLSTTLARGLGQIKADPGQTEQVIMNLAVNARDAMPRGGQLTIETANVELDENWARSRPYASPGSYVMISVSDTGIGIDDEVKPHIFEPFFTTKEKGKGTGLGLATVYGIVKQTGGNISVYSEPGKGATFKIYFPRIDKRHAADAQILENQIARGGHETILLVEDEASVRKYAKDILQSKGYLVLEAANGQMALDVSRNHQGTIQMMLTDVVMPGMSGRELADRLSPLRPDMKIIFMSGYTDDAIVRHGILGSGVSFIQKPFSPAVMARKIREVLDGGNQS